ncbi:MAG: aminotransferase class V-fold PLP-dependent enzyme [Clostridia bacterium]|nr:aminotransferase class V-fold PLP-dependent enzyme [Clostridia bacterium]
MNTPICEFVRRYSEENALRLHMPGHKGTPLLGTELYDLTEIEGADSLYEANGIIRESEENATRLFGSASTLYSTEGSSHCIRAMLYLAKADAVRQGKAFHILAARNVHKTFLSAAALLDFQPEWIAPSKETSYLSCSIDMEHLEQRLQRGDVTAVYLTSPDYLGNRADLASVAALCHRYGVLLLVDNAHGAYLKFLTPSEHPLDLGADLCCDSAHKTLPALTGAAYLHLGATAPAWMAEEAKCALSLFGSTSPSYLILQSLDAVNAYLANGFSETLASYVQTAESFAKRICARGFPLIGNEPLKITLAPKAFGYTGNEFAARLSEQGIVCEFSDPDFTVLMLSPSLPANAWERLEAALDAIPRRTPIHATPPSLSTLPACALPIRDTLFCKRETVSLEQANERILASLHVACPPAVPLAVAGERLDEAILACFAYYGKTSCDVLCDNAP